MRWEFSLLSQLYVRWSVQSWSLCFSLRDGWQEIKVIKVRSDDARESAELNRLLVDIQSVFRPGNTSKGAPLSVAYSSPLSHAVVLWSDIETEMVCVTFTDALLLIWDLLQPQLYSPTLSVTFPLNPMESEYRSSYDSIFLLHFHSLFVSVCLSFLLLSPHSFVLFSPALSTGRDSRGELIVMFCSLLRLQLLQRKLN